MSVDRQQVPTKCSVLECSRDAVVEVILYDVYPNGEVFFEQDRTCPYLCAKHVAENEASAVSRLSKKEAENMARAIFQKLGSSITTPPPKAKRLSDLLEDPMFDFPAQREPRGFVEYRYSNKNAAQGFTIYRPL